MAFFVVCGLIAAIPTISDALAPAKLVRLCEAAAQEKMLSPSGYKRQNVTVHSQVIKPEMYNAFVRRHMLAQVEFSEGEDFRISGDGPTHHVVLLSYDSPNHFGVPVRRGAVCQLVSSHGWSGIDRSNLVFNGTSAFEASVSERDAVRGLMEATKALP